MIFKIKIFIEKNSKHFKSRNPWTVINPFNRENKDNKYRLDIDIDKDNKYRLYIDIDKDKDKDKDIDITT